MTELDSYNGQLGKIRLIRRDTVYGIAKDPADGTLTETAKCDNHAKKFWVIVIAIVEPEQPHDKAALTAIAERNGCASKPFFIGKCAKVDEILVIYKCDSRDRHRSKKLDFERTQCLTLKKGGGQSEKLVKTIEQAIKLCTNFLTNMDIKYPVDACTTTEVVGMTFEVAQATVLSWGTDKFVAFVENAKLKTKKKQDITELEFTCMSRGRLGLLPGHTKAASGVPHSLRRRCH